MASLPLIEERLANSAMKVMAAWRRAIELSLGDADTAKLRSTAQSRTEPASRVEQARILLAYREDPSFLRWAGRSDRIIRRFSAASSAPWPKAVAIVSERAGVSASGASAVCAVENAGLVRRSVQCDSNFCSVLAEASQVNHLSRYTRSLHSLQGRPDLWHAARVLLPSDGCQDMRGIFQTHKRRADGGGDVILPCGSICRNRAKWRDGTAHLPHARR